MTYLQQPSPPPTCLRVERNWDGSISVESNPGTFRREYPRRQHAGIAGWLMLTALVLSPRLRREIGWIGLFGLATGAVWIVFAAGLGGGKNAAAPGLVFLVVGACALGAWVVVTVRSWLLRVVKQDLTAESDLVFSTFNDRILQNGPGRQGATGDRDCRAGEAAELTDSPTLLPLAMHQSERI
jgi:hypothetical protein